MGGAPEHVTPPPPLPTHIYGLGSGGGGGGGSLHIILIARSQRWNPIMPWLSQGGHKVVHSVIIRLLQACYKLATTFLGCQG